MPEASLHALLPFYLIFSIDILLILLYSEQIITRICELILIDSIISIWEVVAIC